MSVHSNFNYLAHWLRDTDLIVGRLWAVSYKMYSVVHQGHVLGFTMRAGPSYLLSWKVRAEPEQWDPGEVCSAHIWVRVWKNSLNDGEGRAVMRCLKKAKLIELARHLEDRLIIQNDVDDWEKCPEILKMTSSKIKVLLLRGSYCKKEKK